VPFQRLVVSVSLFLLKSPRYHALEVEAALMEEEQVTSSTKKASGFLINIHMKEVAWYQ
jgi:hypothetical protein